jgi:hypothetical protein
MSPTGLSLFERNEMPEINWTILDPPERKRTYIFAGETLVFKNVTKIEVRDSGKHRIETADGIKAFVAPGWLCLEVDADQWTF